jgi:hypothetical protein
MSKPERPERNRIKMFFAPKQKLNQMTDAALESRKSTMAFVKSIGEAVVTAGGTFGALLGGGIALLAGASKIMVAVAFGAGAAVPIVAGVAVAVLAGARISQIEGVINSRPRVSPVKKQQKKDPASAPPVLASAPDLGDVFHAGAKKDVTAMKPLKFKPRPQSPSVMP